MPRGADMRTREKLDNVLQTHQRAIDKIFIRAIAMHYALECHFIEVHRKHTRTVIENYLHRSAIRPAACSSRSDIRSATVKDEVFTLLTAKRLDRLLSENETKRLSDV